jgi:hypothetical protein
MDFVECSACSMQLMWHLISSSWRPCFLLWRVKLVYPFYVLSDVLYNAVCIFNINCYLYNKYTTIKNIFLSPCIIHSYKYYFSRFFIIIMLYGRWRWLLKSKHNCRIHIRVCYKAVSFVCKLWIVIFYFYYYTVHFEDSLNIIHQQMYQSYYILV